MNYVKGVFLIMLMLFLGELISIYIDQLLPGSVLGMLLLFASLRLKFIHPDQIRPVATFLTKNMALFFVPASVGVITSWDIISKHWIALTAITIVSTMLVIAVVGIIQQKMGKTK